MVVNTADLVGYDLDSMESGPDSRNRTVPGMSAPPTAMPRGQETWSGMLHAAPFHDVHEPIESLTDHQLLLLLPRIWAFALKIKQWCKSTNKTRSPLLPLTDVVHFSGNWA